MAARVGLTGGIGSGKTSVADCFAARGVQVIDADRIARDLTVPGAAPLAEIVECFGVEMVDAEGRLDRKRLGRAAFASPQARKRLEAILHPPIRAEMHARAQRDDNPYCILDIPLLVETGQYQEMERVLVVACAHETRFARLQQSRGLDQSQIERIMQNQASEEERLAVADDVIDNNGTLAQLDARVRELHELYQSLFVDS